MDILRKPDIEYDKKEGKPYATRKRSVRPAEYTLTRERVIELLDVMDNEVKGFSDVIDQDLSLSSLHVYDPDINESLKGLSGNKEADVISYTAYLAGIASGTREGDVVSETYHSFNTSLWGNASVVLCDYIGLVKTESKQLRESLEKTDFGEEALIEFAQWIGDARHSIVDNIEHIARDPITPAIVTEISEYSPSEVKGAQVAVQKYMSEHLGNVENGLGTLRSMYSTKYGEEFYRGISNARKVAVEPKTSGLLGKLIKGIKNKEDEEARIAKIDVSTRFEMFSEAADEIAKNVSMARFMQSLNTELMKAGGVSASEIMEVAVTTPDTTTDRQLSELWLEGNEPSVDKVFDRVLLESADPFIAESEFNYMKELIFYQGTVTIDGGNIEAGTLTAGAIKIGDRPMTLDVTWGQNQETPGDEETIVPWVLSHTEGIAVIDYNDNDVEFTIEADQVYLLTYSDSGTPIRADDSGEEYWIYLLLNGVSEVATVVAFTEKQEDTEDLVKIGIWDCTGSLGRLVTSYGTTYINGNEIITGTMLADKITTGTLLVSDTLSVETEDATVVIDNEGILVEAGNFRLKDEDTGGLESLVRENRNVIKNHSFEAAVLEGYNPSQYNSRVELLGTIADNSTAYTQWSMTITEDDCRCRTPNGLVDVTLYLGDTTNKSGAIFTESMPTEDPSYHSVVLYVKVSLSGGVPTEARLYASDLLDYTYTGDVSPIEQFFTDFPEDTATEIYVIYAVVWCPKNTESPGWYRTETSYIDSLDREIQDFNYVAYYDNGGYDGKPDIPGWDTVALTDIGYGRIAAPLAYDSREPNEDASRGEARLALYDLSRGDNSTHRSHNSYTAPNIFAKRALIVKADDIFTEPATWYTTIKSDELFSEGPYSLSFYTSAYDNSLLYGSGTITCSVYVYDVDTTLSVLSPVFTEVESVSLEVDIAYNAFDQVRNVLTIPAFGSTESKMIVIEISADVGSWLVDGMQLSLYNKPLVYQPDNALWDHVDPNGHYPEDDTYREPLYRHKLDNSSFSDVEVDIAPTQTDAILQWDDSTEKWQSIAVSQFLDEHITDAWTATALTKSGIWSYVSGRENPRVLYNSITGMVIFQGVLSAAGTVANGYDILLASSGYIPSALRPTDGLTVPLSRSDSSSYDARGIVQTSGAFNIGLPANMGSGTQIGWNVSWVVGM